MSEPVAVEQAVRLHEQAMRERLAGRAAEALAACMDAVAVLEAECGEASVDVAAVLITLGGIREDLSDYAAAEEAFRRSASILEPVEDEDEAGAAIRTHWP